MTAANHENPIFTTAVHAGLDDGDRHHGLSPAIDRSTAFTFDDTDVAHRIHEGLAPGFVYGRLGTPTQSTLEVALAELEHGQAALATASGIGAILCAVLAAVPPGRELVAPPSLYTSTRQLFDEILRPHGIGVRYAEGFTVDHYERRLGRRTSAVYVETPSNPGLFISDLRAIAGLARANDLKAIADNTFATPANQRPLELGFDIVCHSATKYLGGHGDVMAGIMVGSHELVEHARWKVNKLVGSVIAPDSAWLVLRGIRTLPLRMERINASALEVASYLEGHPEVGEVRYPGLESHPDHAVAKRQMSGFGGMVSFDVGDAGMAARIAEATRLCRYAVSLGDVATLIQPSAALTQAALSTAEKTQAGVGAGSIRLSVGIERVSDIIADLDQAISIAARSRADT